MTDNKNYIIESQEVQCGLASASYTCGSSHCCTPVSPSDSYHSGGMQMQLQRSADILLEYKHPVLFNTAISRSGSCISYNSCTGQFTLAPNKNYYAAWWVAVNGTESTSNVEFAVAINDIPHSAASSPLVTCQLSGAAFISAGARPKVLTLINVSENTIRYASTSIQANIVIVKSAC